MNSCWFKNKNTKVLMAREMNKKAIVIMQYLLKPCLLNPRGTGMDGKLTETETLSDEVKMI